MGNPRLPRILTLFSAVLPAPYAPPSSASSPWTPCLPPAPCADASSREGKGDNHIPVTISAVPWKRGLGRTDPHPWFSLLPWGWLYGCGAEGRTCKLTNPTFVTTTSPALLLLANLAPGSRSSNTARTQDSITSDHQISSSTSPHPLPWVRVPGMS